VLKTNKTELDHHDLLCGVLSPLVDRQVILDKLGNMSVDWDLVMEQAHAGMALPHLHCALTDKHLTDIPPAQVIEALSGFFDLNVEMNGRRYTQMLDITRALNAKNIDHVWLKGSTYLVQPDWQKSPRTMVDIDIWVPDEDQHDLALSQLAKIGYDTTNVFWGMTRILCHHYPALYKDGEIATLELHVTLVLDQYSNLLPDREALAAVQWLQWQGEKVGGLGIDDQAMQAYIQCAHMSGPQFLTGQVTLMKTVDLVNRLLVVGPEVLETHRFAVLKQQPWLDRASPFFTYLHKNFNFESPFLADHKYERRMQYPALGTIAKLTDFVQRSIVCIKDGRVGPIRELPERVWSNITRATSVKKL